MENTWFWLIVGWALLCLFSWYWQNILYKKIKIYHPEKWAELNEPDVLSVMTNYNVSPVKRFKMMQKGLLFFVKGDLELDADERIRSVKKINQVVFSIAIIYFIVVLGTALILES